MNRKSVAPSTGGSPTFQTMPWPAARWLRVAQQHGRVFLGSAAEVHGQEAVGA